MKQPKAKKFPFVLFQPALSEWAEIPESRKGSGGSCEWERSLAQCPEPEWTSVAQGVHGVVCVLQIIFSLVRNAPGKSTQPEREINALNKT